MKRHSVRCRARKIGPGWPGDLDGFAGILAGVVVVNFVDECSLAEQRPGYKRE